MSDLHGRPTALELVEAVRGLIEEDLLPGLSGAARHQARIGARALEVVARELRFGPAQEDEHRRRLGAVGFNSDAALARALRSGEVDDSPELRAALRSDVVDRLLVANPAWLQGASSGSSDSRSGRSE